MEFKSLAEFVHAVRFNPTGLRSMAITVGQNGGFLVPEQHRTDILRIAPDTAIVRPRTVVYPPGDAPDAPVNVPALKQGANGVMGGVQVFWINEGTALTVTEPVFAEIREEPQELGAVVVVSDRLLRNSPVASVFLENAFRDAINREEDRVFLTGDGFAKPLGVLYSPARLKVVRGTAGQVNYVDVIAMVKRLLPSSWGRAVWVANLNTLEQLLGMTGPNGEAIFKLGEGGTRQNTLMGLPLIFTDLTPGLGNEGDLMLCDFRYYAIKDGAGPFVTSSASTQTNFTNNISLVKCVWSVDGQGWVAEPLTLDDGVTQVSPFVILQ